MTTITFFSQFDLSALFCTLAFCWPPPVSLFLFASWHFLGYEFSQCGAQCGHRKMSCTSENHTEHFKKQSVDTRSSVHYQHWINRLLLLWGAGERRSSPRTSSPHRAAVVCGLSMAFLSRPVEIGLMKCSTLSESCLNIGCGIHLQLVPTEADHRTSAYTFDSSVPPPHSFSPPPPASFSSTLLDR